MWKQIFEFIRQVFVVAEESTRLRHDVRELQRENREFMRDLINLKAELLLLKMGLAHEREKELLECQLNDLR
jgi:hypothetical protein